MRSAVSEFVQRTTCWVGDFLNLWFFCQYHRMITRVLRFRSPKRSPSRRQGKVCAASFTLLLCPLSFLYSPPFPFPSLSFLSLPLSLFLPLSTSHPGEKFFSEASPNISLTALWPALGHMLTSKPTTSQGLRGSCFVLDQS